MLHGHSFICRHALAILPSSGNTKSSYGAVYLFAASGSIKPTSSVAIMFNFYGRIRSVINHLPGYACEHDDAKLLH